MGYNWVRARVGWVRVSANSWLGLAALPLTLTLTLTLTL